LNSKRKKEDTNMYGRGKHNLIIYNVTCICKMCANIVLLVSRWLNNIWFSHRSRYTRGVQKVLQIDIQKIHKALEFDFI